ncbi:MAG TPA: alpha/beta hydrolase [Acidimicrobiia bacterium]
MISALFFTWFAAAVIWTVNALRRPVIPGTGLPPMWLPGMLISELAPWYFLGRPAVAALFIWAGALDLTVGRIGLVLFVVSELGLLILIRRSVIAAKDAGGSAGVRSLFPTTARVPDGVTVETDVPYWDDYTTDIYRGPNGDNAAALIYLHPGSWMRGRPGRQALGALYTLAASGWVVLDVRYPKSPAATFPEHLIGVKRAILFAKNPGNGLGIDPTRVAIAGGSSGAHLAALAALTWDNPRLQPGFEDADASVIACVPHYGIYDLLVRNPTRYDWPFIAKVILKTTVHDSPGLYRLGSPVDQVRPDAPPFLVVHGEFDSVVLPAESRHFVTALQSVGASVRYHEVRGAQHGFDAIQSMRTRAVGNLVVQFLQECAGGLPREGSSAAGPETSP